jgi:hypothetical protein
MTGLRHLDVVFFPSSRLYYTNKISQRNYYSSQTNNHFRQEQICTQWQNNTPSSINTSKGNGSSFQEKLHMA